MGDAGPEHDESKGLEAKVINKAIKDVNKNIKEEDN